MGIQVKHIIATGVCALVLVASFGCSTRSRPYQLQTSTGKPEVVVNAPMQSVAAYITDKMLSEDYMIKSQSDNVLTFNKQTTYQVQYQDVAGEFRMTYNLVPATKGVRVMTTLFGVVRPDSAYEQIVSDFSKEYDTAHTWQISLNLMKYRLETEKPGKCGITVRGYYGDKIEAVDEDSPAAKAGIVAGDTIVAVDGTPVTDDPVENARMILHHEAGSKHEFVVKRKDLEDTVSLVFEEMTDIAGKSASAQAGAAPADAKFSVESIGAMIERAKVVSVNPGGPAETAGLQAGDVITMIDGDPASDNGMENAKRLTGKTNTSVVVSVKRGEQELTLSVIRKNP
ncbi:MAG: PDZ domain-containing protein [Solirubrobacterales bacterium]